jgi:hypothetical protein
LTVSVPRRAMVKVFGSNKSIEEKERPEYNRDVQDNDRDPDVSHSIKRRNPTVCWAAVTQK